MDNNGNGSKDKPTVSMGVVAGVLGCLFPLREEYAPIAPQRRRRGPLRGASE